MLQKFREGEDELCSGGDGRKTLVEKVGVELDFTSSGIDRIALRKTLEDIQQRRHICMKYPE